MYAQTFLKIITDSKEKVIIIKGIQLQHDIQLYLRPLVKLATPFSMSHWAQWFISWIDHRLLEWSFSFKYCFSGPTFVCIPFQSLPGQSLQHWLFNCSCWFLDYHKTAVHVLDFSTCGHWQHWQSLPTYIMHIHNCVMSMWMTYHYIQAHTHKYSDFLVGVISVGLALALPNYTWHCILLYANVYIITHHSCRVQGYPLEQPWSSVAAYHRASPRCTSNLNEQSYSHNIVNNRKSKCVARYTAHQSLNNIN